jgi:hypothetical protein
MDTGIGGDGLPQPPDGGVELREQLAVRSGERAISRLDWGSHALPFVCVSRP